MHLTLDFCSQLCLSELLLHKDRSVGLGRRPRRSDHPATQDTLCLCIYSKTNGVTQQIISPGAMDWGHDWAKISTGLPPALAGPATVRQLGCWVSLYICDLREGFSPSGPLLMVSPHVLFLWSLLMVLHEVTSCGFSSWSLL